MSQRDVETRRGRVARGAGGQDAAASRRLATPPCARRRGHGRDTRSVQTGDRVGTGDPLFVIADTRELEFEATVPSELRRARDAAAPPCMLTVSGFPTGAIAATSRASTPPPTPATRQVKVYAARAQRRRQAGRATSSPPGTIVDAAGALARSRCPTAAVRRDGAATFAWVLGPDGKLATARRSGPALRDEAPRPASQVLERARRGRPRASVGPVEGLAAGQRGARRREGELGHVPLRPLHQAAGAGDHDGRGAGRARRLPLPPAQRGPVPQRRVPVRRDRQTEYPGASPEVVEREVTKRIEERSTRSRA